MLSEEILPNKQDHSGGRGRAAQRFKRLIVITNREPPPPKTDDDDNVSSGGVIAALQPVMEAYKGVWFSGQPVMGLAVKSIAARAEVSAKSSALYAGASPEFDDYQRVAVRYPNRLHEGYYYGLSNRVLWPLYHSMLGETADFDHGEWDDFSQVNGSFAHSVAGHTEPGDFVWVHDYQLSLVPALLREQSHTAIRIGFYLHIPFPYYDIFRVLPWSADLLRGMLGADLLGFQIQKYCDNFYDCVEQILGLNCDRIRGEILYQGRTIKVRAVPVGIDAGAIHRLLDTQPVQKQASDIRRQSGVERIVIGVDRLDYTKGLEKRFQAFELFLQRNPSWHGRVGFIQVAVPSRDSINSYKELRELTEQLVGHINGKYGTTSWTPIKLLCRSFALPELVSLYLAADIGLVTPLRDGMNLVAKEYCAAHRDSPGVLILSELAGAAEQLTHALTINPYDTEAMAYALLNALACSPEDARDSMNAMNASITGSDVFGWVNDFLKEAQINHSIRAFPAV